MIFLAIGSQENAYPTYLKIKYKALFQNPTLGEFLEFLNPAGSLKSGAFFRLGHFFAPLAGQAGQPGARRPGRHRLHVEAFFDYYCLLRAN